MRLRRTFAATIALTAVIVLGIEMTRDRADPVVATAQQRSMAVETVPAGEGPPGTPPATGPSGAAEPAPSPAGVGGADGSPDPTATAAATVVPAGTGKIALIEPPPSTRPAHGGRVVRIVIGAEGGLGIDSAAFARDVVDTLTDPRGWQGVDGVQFRFVTPEQRTKGAGVDMTVVLASPALTDRLCAPLSTQGQVSCNWAGRAVINARRWELGVPWFNGDLQMYRQYVVNHEVGHGLGHPHQSCPAPGRRSPVMAQQSLRLDGCLPWAWPHGQGG